MVISRVPRAIRVLATLSIGWGVVAAPMAAQQPPLRDGGGISGTVVDSESLLPLRGATVSLEAETIAVLLGDSGEAFIATGRAVISDVGGNYSFEGLVPGRYRIRISRVGYRAAAVAVELRGSTSSSISVGLTVEPVLLQPVEVEGSSMDLYVRNALTEDETDMARVDIARARQRRHLVTDARVITHADVLESVTLGETDLFRALHRVPGVSARDDYGAEFWVRGASWDQTRVYFDGVPLFNPVHAFGLLSAVNTDAIGGALLHPGVRPAEIGDGAAAVLNITSRSGRAGGEVRGLGDLSLASGRLALDGGTAGGGARWMLAGRRSWLDLAAAAAARVVGDPEVQLPYSFSDVAGRFDLDLGDGRALEASGIHEYDRIQGTLPDILHRNRAAWGNTAGRVTFVAPRHGLQTRTTLGLSRFSTVVREAEVDPEAEGGYSAATLGRSDNHLLHISLSSELSPRTASRMLPWRVGYGLLHESGDYEGPEDYLGYGQRPDPESVMDLRGATTRGVLWGERRWGRELGLSLEAGLRIEMGPAVENGSVIEPAPRLIARYAPSADLLFSAGLGRSFQHTQALSGTEPILFTGYAASQIWLVGGRDVPAIRSDIATLGAELWVGEASLLTASAYLRHSTGIALSDPSAGLVFARPLFVTARNASRGLEVSGRRLAGRWTASASYSLARSTIEAAGLSYPASEDRRHALDMTSMVRVRRSLRLGGAFSYASGAPYTRVSERLVDCPSSRAFTTVASIEGCRTELLLGAPNAHRSDAYSSLDLLLDWSTRFRRWDFGAYLQLRNALNRRNNAAMTGSSLVCEGVWTPQSGCDGREVDRDRFHPGLPLLPLLGFRARF